MNYFIFNKHSAVLNENFICCRCAGKNSLIAALFLLVEPIEGSLLIDDINV